MRQIIKEDIENVLNKVLAALEKHDFIELSKLSNHTIHDASIFQEDDPLTLAVLVYSLSKVIRRCVERDKSCPVVEPQLRGALVGQDLQRGIASGFAETPVIGPLVQALQKSAGVPGPGQQKKRTT